MIDYRSLTLDEIEMLERQGCLSENWENITVVDGFDAQFVRNVRFYGDIKLGTFDKMIEVSPGFQRHTGIMNVTLHNVSIGDNCLIENVGNHVSNYVIGDDCHIANVALIETTEGATYGENNLVSVLNEAGAGNVVIWHGLSAQLAALMVRSTDDKELILALRRMIKEEVEATLPDCGTIGNGVKIVNTTEVVNTIVGDDCEISGATRLSDSTILSSPNNSAYIGAGVIAESTIVDEGSSVTGGVKLQDCFIGESCQVSNGFSASASVFFANSVMSNGEACAALCGPFSASHHKSSLLIGASLSFYNAGSATNFSNHAYKMGPIHYGELERGTKTASGAHLLFPAHIGTFSMCMNKIQTHPDTRRLPFSYVIGEGKETYIVPGRNLGTVGLYRDVAKWPKRDQRPATGRKSLVRFEWLSPFSIHEVIAGKGLLEDVQLQCGVLASVYPLNGALIRRSSLEKGLRYYNLALRLFMGMALEQRRKAGIDAEPGMCGVGEWADLSGLLLPVSELERLIDDVKRREIDDVQSLQMRFAEIYQGFVAYQWAYAYPLILEHYELEELWEADEQRVLDDYAKARSEWLSLIKRDAQKEYALGDVESEALEGFLKQMS